MLKVIKAGDFQGYPRKADAYMPFVFAYRSVSFEIRADDDRRRPISGNTARSPSSGRGPHLKRGTSLTFEIMLEVVVRGARDAHTQSPASRKHTRTRAYTSERA